MIIKIFDTFTLFFLIENPFILVRVQGFSCQKVCGAQVTDVAVRTAANTPAFETPNSEINGNVKPFGMVSRQEVELCFCHYKKLEDGLYNGDFVVVNYNVCWYFNEVMTTHFRVLLPGVFR